MTRLNESGKRSVKPKIVGNFIRQRRETLGLSQRALGLLFDPPVTTQFISNVERGVTPLPPAHVATLTKALQVCEADMMGLLEKEYTLKLTDRLGLGNGTGEMPITDHSAVMIPMPNHIAVSPSDYEFMQKLYAAFQIAEPQARHSFVTLCQTMLNVGGNSAHPAVTLAASNSLSAAAN